MVNFYDVHWFIYFLYNLYFLSLGCFSFLIYQNKNFSAILEKSLNIFSSLFSVISPATTTTRPSNLLLSQKFLLKLVLVSPGKFFLNRVHYFLFGRIKSVFERIFLYVCTNTHTPTYTHTHIYTSYSNILILPLIEVAYNWAEAHKTFVSPILTFYKAKTPSKKASGSRISIEGDDSICWLIPIPVIGETIP